MANNDERVHSSIEKLVGEDNWDNWKFQMKLVLAENELWDVVVSGVTEPSGKAGSPPAKPLEDESVRKKDLKAQRIIGTSVTKETAVHIYGCSSAHEMWGKLHEAMELKSDMGMLSLNEKFLSSKKSPLDPMSSYIAKMEEMARKLKNMKNPIPQGTFMSNLLRGLPKEYRHFTTCWESAPAAERTLSNLKARLRVEEDRLGLQPSQDAGQAMMMEKKSKKHKPKKAIAVKFTCHLCNQPGHFRRDCPNNRARNEGAARGALLCGHGESTMWVGDSGATDHMCNSKSVFKDLMPYDKLIKVANGDTVSAMGKGSIEVQCYNGKEWITRDMLDVLYVPALEYNLFSLSKVLDRGYRLESTAKVWKVFDGQELMVMGIRDDAMIEMQVRFVNGAALAARSEKLSLGEWHQRLVHQNVRHVREVLKKHNVSYIDKDFQCEACVMGKMHRLSFPKSESKTEKCGDIIHADLCGPMPTTSLSGARYFLLLKDDYSHFRVVYFLKGKETVPEMIKDYLQLVKTQYKHTVKILRTDNGLEFVNRPVKEITSGHGMIHQTTVAYNPEQNGSAEREMRTLVEAARCLLQAKELNDNLWAEAVNTAAYVLNRTGTSSVQGKSPLELWAGQTPDLQLLNVFGRTVYCHIPDQQRKKLDAKAEICTFVGYANEQKGYRVLNSRRNRVETARNVTFRNPEKILLPIGSKESGKDDEVGNGDDEEFFDSVEVEGDENKDFTVTVLDESQCGITQGNVIPHRLRKRNEQQGAAMVTICEPSSYEEATNGNEREQWVTAMKDEIVSLQKNDTWSLVPWTDQRLVGCRWTYKIKYDAAGNVDRFKARLVARGFTQTHGIDFWDTFSPVIRMESVRMILAIAAEMGLKIRQFDVKTAFLNGELKEEIYMRQPQGFEDASGQICLLKKSLYGLKQSPRCWNEKFVESIKELGLTQSSADPCVFVGGNDGLLILGFYVDDGLIVSDSETELQRVMSGLMKKFEMSECNFGLFLGMEIHRDSSGIYLGQQRYAERVLETYRMSTSHPVSTPSNNNCPNSVLSLRSTSFPYREAVGSLMYLAVMTRPDLAFAVGVASRHLENPTEEDIQRIKTILKYLKGTTGLRLVFPANSSGNVRLSAYCDSDYAGDVDTRRSTSGYACLLGRACVSWRSERQRVVATSTTEAEYIAAAEAVKELVWLERLRQELIHDNLVPLLLMDNQGAIRLVENQVLHRRTKHIDVRYHFIREKFNEGCFEIRGVGTKDQAADMLTKGLGKLLFVENRLKLGLK